MCTCINGCLSVKSPSISHNKLTLTEPKPALHFLSSVQWDNRTFIFPHHSSVIIQFTFPIFTTLHLSISIPLLLFLSFTCSHLHNIVAEDVFNLFSIRLEGGTITLPFLSNTKHSIIEFSGSGALGPQTGAFGNHSKEGKWIAEKSRVKISCLVTSVWCSSNLFAWEHGFWPVLLKSACMYGSECSVQVWCGWTVRSESVSTHYRLANVQNLIGFMLRPFPSVASCLVTSWSRSFPLNSDIPSDFHKMRIGILDVSSESKDFYSVRMDRSCFNRAPDKSCVDKEEEVLPGPEYLKLLFRTLYAQHSSMWLLIERGVNTEPYSQVS